MRAYCQKCGLPQHMIGGETTMVEMMRRFSVKRAPTVVTGSRQVVQGRCAVCGTSLARLVKQARAKGLKIHAA